MEKEGWGTRLKHAWNAFINLDNQRQFAPSVAGGYSSRPDRTRINIVNERSILSSVLTRMAIDVSTCDVRHIKTDDEGRYAEDMKSGLQNCLTLEPNLDQDAKAFMQDVAFTMFDRGVACIVPVDTSINPNVSAGFDILSLRVG